METMSCIKMANKTFILSIALTRFASLFRSLRFLGGGEGETRIYGFVSVPIKDPIWLVIVKFMHVSSDAVSRSLLDLTETNSFSSGHKVCSFIVRLKTFSSNASERVRARAFGGNNGGGIVANEIRLSLTILNRR